MPLIMDNTYTCYKRQCDKLSNFWSNIYMVDLSVPVLYKYL